MAGTNSFRSFRKRSESPFYADTIEVIPPPRQAAKPVQRLPELASDNESELSELNSDDDSGDSEYKEDSSATSSSSPPQTRGRGRPRKNPTPTEEPQQPVKRRPGRPRKHPVPEPAVQDDDDEMDVDSDSSIEVPVKRGRGRPRKNPLPSTPPLPRPPTPTPKRKPGRPRKHALPVSTSVPSSPAGSAGIRRSDRLLRFGIYDQEPTPAKTSAPAPQTTEIRALEDVSIYEARKCIGIERPRFETAEDFIAANDFYADDGWKEVVKKGWFGYFSVGEIARNLEMEGFHGDVDEVFFFLRFSGLWWVDRMREDKTVPA